MCANFEPPRPGTLPAAFAALSAEFDYRTECFPGYAAPILLPESALAPGGAGPRPDDEALVPVPATFGLIPPWARDDAIARRTYNARTETVAEKPSYRTPWKHRRFCLVPVARFFEPSYEAGKPVRWAIHRADGEPFALAGIWEAVKHADGETRRSFSMLTINADDHPLMKHFHAPGDEKRSVVVIPPADYAAWLGADTDAAARALLQPFPAGDFAAEAAPRGGDGAAVARRGSSPRAGRGKPAARANPDLLDEAPDTET